MDFFSEILLHWYQENGRDLPWRHTTDPYVIWISEIILQQTRVAQGTDYFYRFLERFPDVTSLAAAHEDEVLKYWEGLGYYSRARNLRAAALDIMQRFGGVFPSGYSDVLSLKGIGEYTAAAICSFAWRQPYAVVDGNVYRVLARVFGIEIPIDSTEGKKYFKELAGRLLDREWPDLYNQAIMDFGAVQCVPKSPACLFCPLRDKCVAFATGKVDKLPVKEGKTVVKPRYFNYVNIHCRGNRVLAQRKEKDIWQNLYEFPLIETSRLLQPEEFLQGEEFLRLTMGQEVKILRISEVFKHVLSHRIIYACFYEIELPELPASLASGFQVVPEADLRRYALSRLLTLYLDKTVH